MHCVHQILWMAHRDCCCIELFHLITVLNARVQRLPQTIGELHNATLHHGLSSVLEKSRLWCSLNTDIDDVR